MGFFIERDGLRFFQFDLLADQPGLRHGVSARNDGPNLPHGLNLAFNAEADPSEVQANLERVEKALGLKPLAAVRQTHGSRLLAVTKAAAYQPRRPEQLAQDYDALATGEPGVDLLVKLADCQGLILYEPRRRALALVHSGWRGSVQNIIGRVIAEMQKLYRAEPSLILAGISPSLGPCCAEFKNYREELPESFQEFKDSRDHFDFWAISRRQLLDAGLKSENIEAAGLCTKCRGDFFSYRRGDKHGRFGLTGGMR